MFWKSLLLCIFENQEMCVPLIFPTSSELSDSEILKWHVFLVHEVIQ